MLKIIILVIAMFLTTISNSQATQQLDTSGWRKPLDNILVTDIFGRRMRHPTRGTPADHLGLDFRARKPEPIYAVEDGVISGINYGTRYGKIIEINHGNGVRTRYAHLSKILFTSMEGYTVEKGQIIGYSGGTGEVNAPHLHFEILVNFKQVDPFPLYGRLPCKWDVQRSLCSGYFINEDGEYLQIAPFEQAKAPQGAFFI